MLNYLDNDQAAAVELKEPLFFAAAILGAQRTSTGISFRKTNKNLVVMSNPDKHSIPLHLVEVIVACACHMVEECGHSVSVSLNDNYLGVCLSRDRSNHKKSARAADLLVSRAGGGDFDFRAVVSEGGFQNISTMSLVDLCVTLELQILDALASGYDVTL